MIDKRIGPYEITAKLGEGGMGEVYRATDSRLKREVAIKVLPAAFTADKERLARFEREAQLLAQLNHPNIAQIYGIETSGEAHALVMELVDGPTLSERLESGPLALAESLSAALQIAQALEEAHEKGIVHRDLKPQNIKLSSDGKIKVLDFGLAKAMDASASVASAADLARSPTLMHSPTLTAAHGTQLGVILGTAAYMAPEQARGVAVDKRADIWAFGVLLYEMFTGEGLFAEESVVDTLSAVMRKPIELDRLPVGTPPALRQLLRRCLERNPKNRLHDIADARLVLMELENGVEEVAASLPAIAPAPPPRWREATAWAVAAALAVTVGVLMLRQGADADATPRVIRSTLPMPPGVSIELDGERAGMPALSPDGRRVAFGAREGAGPTRIWIQDLDTARAAPLPGTEEGYRPFWSPDGKTIGFFTWSHLATTPAAGGAISLLARARDARGGTWSPNGTIVFAPHPYGPLLAIPDRGGDAREVTASASRTADWTHRFPRFLPDGKHFLYLERSAQVGARRRSEVRVGTLGSPASPGTSVKLIEAATNATYARGHLLFVRDGALVAQPFDTAALRLDGGPVALVSDMLYNDRFSYGVFSVSESDIAAFLTGKQRDLSQLVWRDRSGRRLGELGSPGNISGYGGLALSRDGRWAAVGRIAEGDTDADIWLYDLRRGTESRLVRSASDESDPIFSPDGRFLIFGSIREGASSVLRRDLESGDEVELCSQPNLTGASPRSVAPDSASLTLDLNYRDLTSDIARIPLAPGGELRKILATPADEGFGQTSPDGRWLLWSADDSGRFEIYVARYPDLGSRVQISRAGGVQPRWSSTGTEIFFKTLDNMLTTLPIDTGAGTISVGAQRPLFQISEFTGWTYAVSPDDQRILVREPLAESEASPITLLTDWSSLLARR